MSKTNTGLVSYAKAQIGNPYWYGCFGQKASRELYKAKKKQYPSMYEWSCPTAQLNKKVHDCVGLIKGYLWCDSAAGAPKYNANQDVSANGMYAKCTKKGKIKTIPEVPGVLVFMDNHVGVYIGGGEVIEARGHAYGVVKTKLKDRSWKNWGYCPYITYEVKKAETKPTADSKSYYKKYTGKSVSIVDALNSIGVNSSYANRKKIAKANGITLYVGSAKQNIKMLDLLKKGKLIKAK